MSAIKNPDTNPSHLAGVKLGNQQKISTYKIISLIIADINQGIRCTINFIKHLISSAYF